MATQAAAPVPEAKAEAAPPPKSGKLWKLVALTFMVAVIGGEALMAVIFLSGGDSTEQAEGGEAPAEEDSAEEETHEPAAEGDGHGHGEGEGEAEHGGHGDEEGHAPKIPAANATGEVEVDLGQYSLTAFQPASNTTLLVDFHLYGTVRAADAGLFADRFEESKHRIRDQVIVTVRCAEMTDFADPGLALIKRQILEKSNATLGRRLLRGVVFSDFTLIEQ
jgi:flagellar basal body-associated protein FliL